MDGLEGDAPMEFYKVERCLAGTPFYFVPACIITSLRDLCLSFFTRHFGQTGGGWTGWRVTLLRSSEWNIRLLQGFRPTDSTPACILTSLRDYFRTAVLCRDSASLHFASQ